MAYKYEAPFINPSKAPGNPKREAKQREKKPRKKKVRPIPESVKTYEDRVTEELRDCGPGGKYVVRHMDDFPLDSNGMYIGMNAPRRVVRLPQKEELISADLKDMGPGGRYVVRTMSGFPIMGGASELVGHSYVGYTFERIKEKINARFREENELIHEQNRITGENRKVDYMAIRGEVLRALGYKYAHNIHSQLSKEVHRKNRKKKELAEKRRLEEAREAERQHALSFDD